MNHTPQIKKAIQFAARKHHGQLRISSTGSAPLPYFTHLFSTAILVAEDGASDDVVTAALLHDTLEDTDTTREEIVAAFNEHVADLVEAVSEVKEKEGVRLSWEECKQNYLAQLEHAPVEAVVIAIADKIDNIESKIEEFEHEGEAIHAHWRQPKESYLWFYTEALRIAEERLPGHPLTLRLAEVHAKQSKLFG